jgi:hypothetical protein
MRKYATDLNTEDKIIDKHTGRVVTIDAFDIIDVNTFVCYGYYEDNGEDWTRTLTADSIVRLAE